MWQQLFEIWLHIILFFLAVGGIGFIVFLFHLTGTQGYVDQVVREANKIRREEEDL